MNPYYELLKWLFLPCAIAFSVSLNASNSFDVQPALLEIDDKVEDGTGEDNAGKNDTALTLEPARTIEFETNEGTWLSLDISPDGKTIIFELLGDIYTMSANGGNASKLFGGMSFQSQPVFAPDGTKIAFISDESGSENLYIANLDGTEVKKLTNTSTGSMLSPEWSTDSQYVYISQAKYAISTFAIWMYHRNGGAGIEVVKSADSPATPRSQLKNHMGLSASSDGKYLYFSRRIGGLSYNMTDFPWQVIRYDLNEGTESTIISAQGGAFKPVVSPDGKYVAYGTRKETDTSLRLRNLQSGNDYLLAYPITHDDQESLATRDVLPSYTFTADGKSLILNLDGKIKLLSIVNKKVTDIPFSANVSIGIGPDLVNQTPDPTSDTMVRMIQGPSVSPNGEQVIFSALGELYSMSLKADSKAKKIKRASKNAYMPSWSQDGRWITYVTWNFEGGHIWKMKANGRSKPKKVTSIAGYYSEPNFSPDGREIIAIRTSNHQFNKGYLGTQRDLVALSVDKRELRVIQHGVNFNSIHFTELKNRVYLYNGAKLISLRLDGTDQREHLEVKGQGLYFATKPVPANSIKISPNRKWALAKSQQQLHLVAVPQIGKTAQSVNISGASVPLKTLSDIGVDYFGWSRDGDTISWSVGSTIHTQALSSIEWSEKKDEKTESDKSEKETKEVTYSTYKADIPLERDYPKGDLLLSGAKTITMSDTGVIENADIWIKNGRFEAVGLKGSLNTPSDIEVLDVTGKFIVPGFIDTHAHWRNWSRPEVKGAYHWPFIANLAYGVTSGLDVQTGTTDIFVAQDMVESGRMIGLRPWSTGPGVFSDNAFKDKEHAVNVLKRYKEHYRTKNIKAYISGNRKQRQLIVEAAKEVGIMPTTEGGLDLKLGLTHILDGFAGNEHNFPIYPLYNDVVQLTAQSGIGYTLTLLVTYGGPWGENYYFTKENPHDDPKLNRFIPHHIIDAKTKRRPWFRDEEYAFSRIAESAAEIQRAGGKVGIGSHGQLQGLGFHWEMRAYTSGGATPIEVLKAATIDGAHIIGHSQEVGSIESGKYADLVILNSDPLISIKNAVDIHRVMSNGRLYIDDTMEQVWPERKALPKMWFSQDER